MNQLHGTPKRAASGFVPFEVLHTDSEQVETEAIFQIKDTIKNLLIFFQSFANFYSLVIL